ncbi:MAG: hybrid sensor histidine kinase/response regulator [Pseudohaliea sp.]
MTSWFDQHLGLIYQGYGLAFFALGVAALMARERAPGASATANLGWLAAFGLLHGLQEFIDGERLRSDAAWLAPLATLLLVTSFAALFEFGRRQWNRRKLRPRLAALPLGLAAGAATAGLALALPSPAASLELGGRYLLGAPGALLAGLSMLAGARSEAPAFAGSSAGAWLRLSALAMLAYAALTLLVSPASGALLAGWLPTTADFAALTGLPVQLPRGLCAVFLAVGFVNFFIQRRLIEATRGELARLSRVASETTNGVIITDPTGAIEWINPGFTRITGYTLEEIRGRKPGAVLQGPATDRDTVAAIGAALARREGFEADLVNYTKTGEPYWIRISCNPLHGPDGTLQGFMAIESEITEQKQNAEKLERSESLMRGLFETAPVGIILNDFASTRLIDCNAAFLAQTGYTREELRELSIRDVTPDEYAESDLREFKQVRDTGRYGPYEKEALRKDGSRYPVRLQGVVVEDPSGARVIWSFVEDISAQREFVARLREEAQYTEAILQQMVDGLVTIDGDGLIQSVNPAAERIFAYAAADMIGQNVAMLMPSAHGRRHDSYISNYRTSGVAKIIGKGRELEGRRSDGTLFPIDAAVWEIERSGRTLYVGLIRDITERKRLEDDLWRLNQSLEERIAERTSALDAALQRNRMIIDTALDGFLVLDGDGHVREANPALCTMLGYEKAELEALTLRDIEAIDSEDEFMGKVERVRTRGHARFDSRHRRKDGSTVEVEVSIRALELDGEDCYYAFINDISERKAAEAALRESRDEAQRANAAKSDFLSRMSHELRTPLNAILGFTQLLQLPGARALDEQQDEQVREIHEAGKHLLTLVNEVLELEQIESGQLAVDVAPVALPPLLEHCTRQVGPAASARGITVTVDAGVPCTVLADRTRIREVLLNLLSNAIKYNRESGRVAVSVTRRDGAVRVAVRDTGPGLSDAQQARLFRPFERLETAYEGIEGSGIGLAIARRLVEAMAGRIGVESAPGEGSTFWFELPPSDDPEPADAPALQPAQPPDPVPQARRKVLYVEDSPANLRLVEKFLARRPAIKLLTAGTAEEGLALAARERPALILLDINLPGMDGFEALRRLRENPVTRDTPVLAVTANAMPRDVERGRKAGFADYLTKPLDLAELLARIDRWAATETAG